MRDDSPNLIPFIPVTSRCEVVINFMQVNANDQIISPYFDRWTPTNDVFFRNGLLDSPHRANSHGEARKTMYPASCRGSRWVGFHHPSVLAVSVEKNNKKQIDHDKTNTEIERQTKNGTCLSKNSDLWWISLNISLYFSLFPGTQMLGPCRIYYSWISFCNFCSKSPTAKLIEMDHDDPNAKIGLNW